MKIRSDMLFVGLILVAGFLLRLIGINHGLPGIYHPDEPIVVSRAADLVINGKWNPKFFHWPSLLIYILALEYEIIYLIGFLIGKFKSSEEFFRFYLLDRGIFHLVGRITIACMSAGLGYYIYLILKTIKSHQAGLIGLVLAECSFLLVKHGQYVTPDIPAAFFATVSLYYLTRYHFADSSRRLLTWSGVFIGLGIASKYNYALMLIPLWIICLSKQDRTLKKRLSDLVLSSIAAILIFIITNPFILLDYPTFSFQFYEISRHLKEGHIGMEARGNASIDLLQHLIRTGGPVLFLSSLGGIILLLKRNFLFGVALIIFPLALIVSHGQWQVTADRYAVPLVPFVIIFASFIISFILENKSKVKLIAIVVLLIIFLESLFLSFVNCLDNSKRDTREIARNWIEEYIPSGSQIGIEKNGPTLEHAASAYHREPSFYYFDITPWFGESFHGEAPLDLLVKNRPQYVIINSIVFDRYYPDTKTGDFNHSSASDVFSIWHSYYDYLNNYGQLIYEISQGKDSTGPTVRIYYLPEYDNNHKFP